MGRRILSSRILLTGALPAGWHCVAILGVVMAVEPIPRFSFSFSDLAVPETSLRVLESSSVPVPGGAERVRPLPRPRWLPRLLKVSAATEPLLLEVRGAAAPPFAARLVAGLAAIYASAGAE